MSDVEVEWAGEDRRTPVTLDVVALKALNGVHDAVVQNASATQALAQASLDEKRRSTLWLRLLTAAVCVVIVGMVVLGYRSLGTRDAITEGTKITESNNRLAQEIQSCIDPAGQCYQEQKTRSDEYVAVLTEKFTTANDTNRKTLAQEIICYTKNDCPPEYDRDHIPDLAGLQHSSR